MFVGRDGEIYINELAPRPHNSGHYSIEARNFSQFAIHNRAVCNWPLPKIELLSRPYGECPDSTLPGYGNKLVKTELALP